MYGRSVEKIVDMKVRAWEIRQEAARRRLRENKEDVTIPEAKEDKAPATTATQTFKITKVNP